MNTDLAWGIWVAGAVVGGILTLALCTDDTSRRTKQIAGAAYLTWMLPVLLRTLTIVVLS